MSRVIWARERPVTLGLGSHDHHPPMMPVPNPLRLISRWNHTPVQAHVSLEEAPGCHRPENPLIMQDGMRDHGLHTPPASLPPVNRAQAVGVGEPFGAAVAPEFRNRPIGAVNQSRTYALKPMTCRTENQEKLRSRSAESRL